MNCAIWAVRCKSCQKETVIGEALPDTRVGATDGSVASVYTVPFASEYWLGRVTCPSCETSESFHGKDVVLIENYILDPHETKSTGLPNKLK